MRMAHQFLISYEGAVSSCPSVASPFRKAQKDGGLQRGDEGSKKNLEFNNKDIEQVSYSVLA